MRRSLMLAAVVSLTFALPAPAAEAQTPGKTVHKTERTCATEVLRYACGMDMIGGTLVMQ